MKSFTRVDLAKELAKRLNVTDTVAKATVGHFLAIFSERLLAGQKLEFRGFGLLDVVTHKAKIGRNPKRPADAYLIPARKVVRFRSGRQLEDGLNPPKFSAKAKPGVETDFTGLPLDNPFDSSQYEST
jgi:integration host factor subunit beta